MNSDFAQVWGPRVLSILRIMAALLFMEHGLQKLFAFPAPSPHPAPPEFVWVVTIAGVLELVGGALLAVGLFSRLVAFILSGEMAVAYFLAHAPQNFYPIINGGDSAILYCFVFFYISIVGGGPWSLDAMIWGRKPAVA